jgi:hypothetical protein
MKDEALKLALEAAYLAGFNASGEGWNGEYPFGDYSQQPEQDKNWYAERDNFIKQALAAPVPCCGKYETCTQACTPRGKFLGAREAAAQPAPVQPVADLHFFKQVLSVAIAGLYEHYEQDVINTFSIEELSEVVDLSESLRPRQVEDIYKQMWVMLATPPAAQRTWVGLKDPDFSRKPNTPESWRELFLQKPYSRRRTHD